MKQIFDGGYQENRKQQIRYGHVCNKIVDGISQTSGFVHNNSNQSVSSQQNSK